MGGFAGKAKVPTLPCYVVIHDGVIQARFGEPLIERDVEVAAAHYAQFLESEILRDPSSWAFMLDKRWRKILAAAAERVRAGGAA